MNRSSFRDQAMLGRTGCTVTDQSESRHQYFGTTVRFGEIVDNTGQVYLINTFDNEESSRTTPAVR